MSEDSGAGKERKARGGLNRERRRKSPKSKVRVSPFPTRLHHHPVQSKEALTPSPGTADTLTGRTAQYRQLRKEAFKTKMAKSEKRVKSEKNTNPHSPCVQRCEQWSLHKPKNKSNVQPHTKSSAKRSERLHTESDLVNSCLQRPDKNPLTCKENVTNLKPKEQMIPRDPSEKEIHYAGAKFSDPPPPSVLPKPPSHWMGKKSQHIDQCKEWMTYHLKRLLKVQL